MTGDEALKQLRAIKFHESRKLDALAKQIAKDSREPVSALVDHWVTGGGAEPRKAEEVLVRLEELAAARWLAVRATGQRQVSAALLAGEAYRRALLRLSAVLTPMLESQAKVPQPKSPEPVEETRPATRECDEAYLLLRRALRVDGSEDKQADAEYQFLRLTNADRDREITRLRGKNEWSILGEER